MIKDTLAKHKLNYDFINDTTSVHSLFDVNVCGKSVPGGKPELFKIAAEEIQKMTEGKVSKFVVFEDGVSGVEAAKDNGFFAVGIIRIGKRSDFEKVGADIIVNDLDETSLDEIVQKFNLTY